ncbi:hypothetical protein C0J52_21677 [Blattella germanica]|nr:hypothetical protein C0J52_21677 [Blattella germanica]
MEKKFLRGILGKTIRDKIRNTVIREELKIEEIKRDYNGKPRTRWLDQVRKDIEKRDQDWIEMQITEVWMDRDDWRFLCNSRPKRLETISERKKERDERYYCT